MARVSAEIVVTLICERCRRLLKGSENGQVVVVELCPECLVEEGIRGYILGVKSLEKVVLNDLERPC